MPALSVTRADMGNWANAVSLDVINSAAADQYLAQFESTWARWLSKSAMSVGGRFQG